MVMVPFATDTLSPAVDPPASTTLYSAASAVTVASAPIASKTASASLAMHLIALLIFLISFILHVQPLYSINVTRCIVCFIITQMIAVCKAGLMLFVQCATDSRRVLLVLCCFVLWLVVHLC